MKLKITCINLITSIAISIKQKLCIKHIPLYSQSMYIEKVILCAIHLFIML